MPTIWESKTLAQVQALANMQNTVEHFPNGLKVSKTDNPMFFPVENTYRVGSAEIKAIMSNAIAVGTGQTGQAPLYVFCTDGVYALYVDASGEMVYKNARVIARDVCNNPRSVTPIDTGVVFTTDRGLMEIAGEQVLEIGEPAEGNVLNYADSTNGIKIAKGALTKVADLPAALCDTTDFLTYLKNGAIVNYNHNERELIISNPNKQYSYVLNRDGNWSRRDYTASEYVNNYPTSYRLMNGNFYKVDEEGNSNTPLEERKEADNKFFYLSNVIKLGSIGFKEAHRFVVRGDFKTQTRVSPQPVITWQQIAQVALTQSNFYGSDSDTLVNPDTSIEGLSVGDVVRIQRNGQTTYQEVEVVDKFDNPIRVQFSSELGAYHNAGNYTFYKKITTTPTASQNVPHIGCYVLGSYDGRKWAMLGGNEKTGTFTDIGCKIERTDVKFLRVCLAGQVTGKTRINYMEMSTEPSALNTKIR